MAKVPSPNDIHSTSDALQNQAPNPAPSSAPNSISKPLPPSSAPAALPPDPEVRPRRRHRRFSSEFKLKILAETDACTDIGAIGAILRREGLYSSQLSDWRRERKQGLHSAFSRKPGPQSSEDSSPLAQLERENALLKARLRKAEAITEIQKKVSDLLGLGSLLPQSEAR